jgi:zinc transport system substrate-binding protein
VLDPLGSRHAPGPDLYPALIRDLAEALTGCLEGS